MKPQVKLGALIEGTMRPIDTIPAMLNEAERRGLDPWKTLQASMEQWQGDINLPNALWHISSHEKLVHQGKPLGFSARTDVDWWDKDLDNGQGWTNHEENQQVIGELIDLLNEGLTGATFGTQEGDGACLGYWPETGDLNGEGKHFGWRHVKHGIELYQMEGKETIFFQLGDDMNSFLTDIGAVDFVWMNDPRNEEGRAFKTIEEHYDAIMDPYFGND